MDALLVNVAVTVLVSLGAWSFLEFIPNLLPGRWEGWLHASDHSPQA